MLRQIIALLIAAMLASGPAAAFSVPCPAAMPVAVAGDACMAAMAKASGKADKQCVEHCAALVATTCVLPASPALLSVAMNTVLPAVAPGSS